MKTVSSAELQKNFGAYREAALKEPLAVQHYGQSNLVLVSMTEYQRLKDLDRQVLRFDDLTDQELAAIADSDIPKEFQYHSDQISDE